MSSPQTDASSGVRTSTAIKVPVLSTATTNITLSGSQTVGGEARVTGDRVAAVGQTDGTTNGLYIYDSTGPWVRTQDFDGQNDVVEGTMFLDNATGTIYKLATEDPEIGTDVLTFTSIVLNGIGAINPVTLRQAIGLPGTFGADGTIMIPYAAATDGWAFVKPGLDSPLNLELSVVRNVSNGLDINIKGQGGTTPSVNNPIPLAFRTTTLNSGSYVIRTITAAVTLTLPTGSSLGVANNEVVRGWIVAVDNAGTVELAVINCRKSGTGLDKFTITALSSSVLVTTQAVAAAVASQVFYSNSVLTSKAIRVLGYFEYNTSPPATAGVFTADPTAVVLKTHDVRLPGEVVQSYYTASGAVATTVTHPPEDDTALQFSETADLGLPLTVAAQSKCNVLEMEGLVNAGCSAASSVVLAIFRNSTGNALNAEESDTSSTNGMTQVAVTHRMLVPTVSSDVFVLGVGAIASVTLTINGSAGGRLYNGVMFSSFSLDELQG